MDGLAEQRVKAIELAIGIAGAEEEPSHAKRTLYIADKINHFLETGEIDLD